MLNILINNIRFVNPTSLIRALKKTGKVQLWGTDTKPLGFFSSSLFVEHYIKAPPVDDTNSYLYFMKKLCIENNIHMIIPGSDKDVQFYSEFRNQFPPIIILPEKKAIETFYDKNKATTAVEKLGINIPLGVKDLFQEEIVIFRKKFSSSSTGIHIVDLKRDNQIPNLFNEDYFLQRFILGTEYTVDLFADNCGSPKLIIPRKRLEIKNGMSTCCQICKHEKIIQICQKLLNNYYLPGLTNVQFIENEKNIYFIELNMRFAGSGITGIAASFNYLEQYIDHFFNNKPLESLQYYMDRVVWSSIITRYYDESIYLP